MNNGRRFAEAQQTGKWMVGGFVTRPMQAIQPILPSHLRRKGSDATWFPNGSDPIAAHPTQAKQP